MNDLISRSALLQEVRRCKEAVGACANHDYMVGYASALSGVEGQIADAPAVDAVEVVRCKDCRHRWDEMRCPMYDMSGCFAPLDMSTDEGFCNYGAKRDAEVQNETD